MARYSEILMDHFNSPRNFRKIEPADRVGVVGVPGRGRFMVLYLRLDGNRVVEVGYQCHGCGATIAAGSILTEMIGGCTIDECLSIEPADVVTSLDGLPGDKLHCAGFAVKALRQALDDND